MQNQTTNDLIKATIKNLAREESARCDDPSGIATDLIHEEWSKKEADLLAGEDAEKLRFLKEYGVIHDDLEP